MVWRIAVLIVLTIVLTGMLFAQTPGQSTAPDVSVDAQIPLWSLMTAAAAIIGAWAVAMHRLGVFGRYHQIHFTHTEDSVRHWTERERDALDKTLNEIRSDVKTLLQRHQ